VLEATRVDVDLEVHAAYVTYRDGKSVETRDILDDGTVAYDVDDHGDIIGIEILGIDTPEYLEAARTFAAKHELAFPRDLRGNLAA